MVKRKRIKQFIKNNPIVKDFLLFAVVTILFHFLYWETNMNLWLFGSWTKDIYDFFTLIALKGTALLSEFFFATDFEVASSCLRFFDSNNTTICTMEVVDSCSGIKQLLQLFMIMLIVPNKLWKRMVYFLCASIVVLFFNIVRIFGLTGVLLYHSDKYQFIHDWIGRPFHYVVVFLIWVIWIEFFAYTKKNPLSKNEKKAELIS